MQIITAGAVYFAVVFGAGFVFGAIRETALTPVYGKTAAVLLEAPFMLVAIVAGAWIAVHRGSPGQSKLALAAVGIIGLALVQLADLGVGLGLRGMSIENQLNYLQTTAGRIYLGLLAIFVIMPLILEFLRSKARRMHRKALQARCTVDEKSGSEIVRP